jgi:hypothetical protein
MLTQGSVQPSRLLEGDPVARVIEAQHFCVWNPFGEPIGLRGPNQDVFAWTDQEGRQLNLR